MTIPWIEATAFAVSAAVLYGASRIFAARPKGSPEAAEVLPLHVVSRTRVGIGRTLVLVEVDGRRLLLGSTKEHWAALADLGRAPGAATEEEAFEEIEAELLRASRAARQRRMRS
ncbi:MAG TPA: flagellar biosynthetic protein FliO [Candidatus Binatia bacterium]|nr:flagellar biosynthetic protein FliO [Candidatus Binatia bacterium]